MTRLCVALLLLSACGSSDDRADPDAAAEDAGEDATGDDARRDAGAVDARPPTPDAAIVIPDARPAADAGAAIDARQLDARITDARSSDATGSDAAIPDARVPDARLPDARIPDAATPDAPILSLAIHDGEGQRAAFRCPVAVPPSVRLTQGSGTPVSGATVSFAVSSGSGTITGATQITDADGVASVGSWVLGPQLPFVTDQLTATASAGSVVFHAEGQFLPSTIASDGTTFGEGSPVCSATLDTTELLLGAQGGLVYLAMQDRTYDTASEVLSFDLTVQNLVPQPLGTSDGTTPSLSGVRVFIVAPPEATAGSGVIDVLHPSGVTTLTADGQAYFALAGAQLGPDGVLAQNETSGPVHIDLVVPSTVDAFAYQVLVVADVPSPLGFYDVSSQTDPQDPPPPGAIIGFSITPRDAYGHLVFDAVPRAAVTGGGGALLVSPSAPNFTGTWRLGPAAGVNQLTITDDDGRAAIYEITTE